MAGVGFRFRPTDEFLIAVLEQKRKNPKFDVLKTTKFGDLSEMYMYGPEKEPWKLFSGAHEITELSETSDAKRKIREKYVVTELNRIEKGKKNCSRVAGNGYWSDKGKKKPVYFRGQQVGHWRTLTYEYSSDDGAADGKRYYYMNELHLSKPCNFVICRVLKNLSKDCQVKFSTKRSRQDDDQDFQPATKRSCRRREEEFQASSSCLEIDQERVDDDPQEYYNETIDFSDPNIFGCIPDMLEVGENQVADMLGVSDIPESDPSFFNWVSDMLGQNQEHQAVDCPEMQASSSMVDPQNLMSMNDEVYVPDMSGLGQNQEQVAEFWDFEDIQVNCCSSTMPPNQGSFANQWSVEDELMMRELLA